MSFIYERRDPAGNIFFLPDFVCLPSENFYLSIFLKPTFVVCSVKGTVGIPNVKYTVASFIFEWLRCE